MVASIWAPGSTLTSTSPFTSPALFSVGTVAAPGIAFTGFTGSGFYSAGSGSVDVAIAGAQRAKFDASGLTLVGGKLITAVEVDLASAATTDIGAVASNSIRITGTTGITSFGTNYRGPMFLRFAASLAVTNSGLLITPGFLNLVTNAGDTCIVVPKATAGVADGWAILSYSTASNQSLPGAGTNSILIGGASTANGIQSIAIGANANADGLAGTAIGRNTVASGTYSTAIGIGPGAAGATASGQGSVALGASRAVGTDSLAACVGDNTTTYGTVVNNSIAIGYHTQAGTPGTVKNVAIGYESKSIITGKYAYAAGSFAAPGDAQTTVLLLRGTTTNAAPAVITSDAAVASAINQVILPNDSTFTFSILVVARRTDADNESAAYKFEGCVDRNANAASTALVGSVTKTVLAEDTVAWDCNVTADVTNGGLAVTVTGEAAKTIRWVASCTVVEITG